MSPARRALHLLDIGTQQYGDCLVYEAGGDTVLFDGGHAGDEDLLFGQLERVVPKDGDALRVSLLVVTHAHGDHIGALPALVNDGRLAADWALVVDPAYGWGRDGSDASPLDAVGEEVRGLAAALHEELPSPSSTDAELRRFMADAASGERTYRDMLDALRQDGTRIVRHGRDAAGALLNAFKGMGLEVLGPTKAHLRAASREVSDAMRDAVAAADAALLADAAGDPAAALRRLLAGGRRADAVADALADAASRNGAAVNCQSTVVKLKAGRSHALLAGDMQFRAPGQALKAHITRLRGTIEQAGRVDVFKLSHHGSENGWDMDLYRQLGRPKYLAISLGDHAGTHPDRSVLDDLKALRPNVTWARSDRNGHVAFSFGAAGVRVGRPRRGRLNDPKPPKPDVLPAAPAAPAAGGAGRDVEIVTRAPYGVAVTITIGSPDRPPAPERPSGAGAPLPKLELFGGRDLGPLLFVTCREALADRIGMTEAAHALDALRARRALLYDELPARASFAEAAALVREQLARHGGVQRVKGVVLIGGYSIVPSQRLDCLPDELRDRVDPGEDLHDRFVVWSDDFYVDLDVSNNIPELPISRIADGRSPDLVFAQLQAGNVPRSKKRTGVRNRERPFAIDVFREVPGAGRMLVSAPALFDDPRHRLDGDVVYLMLHGSDVDGTTFWGQRDEEIAKYPAVKLENVPAAFGLLAFTGCCWGALLTDKPAVNIGENDPMGSRTTDQSIALRILRAGATAFVGCTGAHYSPDPPGTYHGGAMHHAFWRAYTPGGSPAEALYAAKRTFARDMPHGLDDALDVAIDIKILREYTCLGLGW